MSLLQRFLNNVSKPNGENGCWVWTKSVDKNGYGICRINGIRRAHRASYALLIGPIPKGLLVLHHCDSPPCVNPKHLWVGTNRDNVDDMLRKKRSLTGEKNTQSKLTEEQILAIRIEYVPRSLGTPKGVGGRGVKGYLQGSIRFLAEKYKVSRWEIKTIVQNKSWKHL